MYRLPPPSAPPAWAPARRADQDRPEVHRARDGRAAPRSWLWRCARWSVLLGIWAALALAVLILACAWDLPRPEAALEAVRRPSLRLADRDGRVFATYGDLVGRKVHLADLPPALPEAVVAIEDRRFWSHWGIDVVGILRAALVNLRAGRIVQGGSTLTQQVAKNLFLSNARTFRRKVQEILLTLWLEERFSKREILEIWLNRVYLGGGAWGVDAAAQLYFGVPAARLRLWQCAVLAGLPRAPSRFNPRADPRAAAARAREVLAAMVAAGTLGPDQARDAAARIAFPPRRPGGGYFADWAAEQAEAAIPEGTDALVRTTLDPRAQAVAESALRRLLDGPGAAAGATQGAVAVLDAASGGVRALVGGRDYAASPYDRAVAARRQPGSAFKPFVWLAALEHGMHPDDAVLDAPITLDGWSPRNFDGRFRGEVTLEDALADSLNTASVRLLRAVGGPSVVAAVARRLGIADRLTLNDTLALGTSDVGVLELASAYAAFFTGGLRRPPTAIEAVTGGSLPGGGVPGGSVPGGSVPGGSVPGGSVPGGVGTAAAIAVPPAVAPIRVMSPDAAADMLRMLRAVVARGSGRAAAVPGRVVAGKTGTTQDSRDAWFVGGVDGRVIAVWIGNDDGAPMHGVTGGGLPADLFGQIARALP